MLRGAYDGFAYNRKFNLVERLEGAKLYGEHDKVVYLLCVERFNRPMPEFVENRLRKRYEFNLWNKPLS